MRHAIQRLAAALVEGIATDEAIAGQLGITSREAIEDGATALGEAMQRNARLHRVAAIKNRAHLSALIDRYGRDYAIAMPKDVRHNRD